MFTYIEVRKWGVDCIKCEYDKLYVCMDVYHFWEYNNTLCKMKAYNIFRKKYKTNVISFPTGKIHTIYF